MAVHSDCWPTVGRLSLISITPVQTLQCNVEKHFFLPIKHETASKVGYFNIIAEILVLPKTTRFAQKQKGKRFISVFIVFQIKWEIS